VSFSRTDFGYIWPSPHCGHGDRHRFLIPVKIDHGVTSIWITLEGMVPVNHGSAVTNAAVYYPDMEAQSFVVSFPDTTSNEANKHTQQLADSLGDLGIKAKPARTSKESQDFGATLIVLLGTTSIAAIAEGIKTFIARTGTRLDFEGPGGRFSAKNLRSEDIASAIRLAMGPK
jgi:hypothetical protein